MIFTYSACRLLQHTHTSMEKSATKRFYIFMYFVCQVPAANAQTYTEKETVHDVVFSRKLQLHPHFCSVPRPQPQTRTHTCSQLSSWCLSEHHSPSIFVTKKNITRTKKKSKAERAGRRKKIYMRWRWKRAQELSHLFLQLKFLSGAPRDAHTPNFSNKLKLIRA